MVRNQIYPIYNSARLLHHLVMFHKRFTLSAFFKSDDNKCFYA